MQPTPSLRAVYFVNFGYVPFQLCRESVDDHSSHGCQRVIMRMMKRQMQPILQGDTRGLAQSQNIFSSFVLHRDRVFESPYGDHKHLEISQFTPSLRGVMNGMRSALSDVWQHSTTLATAAIPTLLGRGELSFGEGLCAVIENMSAEVQCTAMLGLTLAPKYYMPFQCRESAEDVPDYYYAPSASPSPDADRSVPLSLPALSERNLAAEDWESTLMHLSPNSLRGMANVIRAAMNIYGASINHACRQGTTVSAMLPGWAVESVLSISNTHVFSEHPVPAAAIYRRESSLVGVIRGTLLRNDIIADFDFMLVEGPTHTPDGLIPLFNTDDSAGPVWHVPRGFFNTALEPARSLWAAMLRKPTRDGAHVEQLLVTGHSLGGFAAHVAGLWLHLSLAALRRVDALPPHLQRADVRVLSVGAGRIGDEGFMQLSLGTYPGLKTGRLNVMRLVFEDDPVANVPCSTNPNCYHHSAANKVFADERSEIPLKGLIPGAVDVTVSRPIRIGKGVAFALAPVEASDTIEIPSAFGGTYFEFPLNKLLLMFTHLCSYNCIAAQLAGELKADEPACHRDACLAKYDFSHINDDRLMRLSVLSPPGITVEPTVAMRTKETERLKTLEPGAERTALKTKLNRRDMSLLYYLRRVLEKPNTQRVLDRRSEKALGLPASPSSGWTRWFKSLFARPSIAHNFSDDLPDFSVATL